MDTFLARHALSVKGTLSGFDRVRFRGTLRWLASLRGMGAWLHRANVLLKDFRDYAMGLTDQIKESTAALADQAGRPLHYLTSSSLRKDDVARDVAQRDGITEALLAARAANTKQLLKIAA